MIHRDVKQLLKDLLSPNLIVSGIQDIVLNDLKDQGYDTLLLDMDNTFVGPNSLNISLSARKWIQVASEMQFSVYIVTNNRRKKRVEAISKQLNLSSLMCARKPFICNIEELAYQYNLDFKHVIFVGDQLFTDVLVANLLGSYSILTDPVEKKLQFIKMLQKDLEQLIRFKWLSV